MNLKPIAVKDFAPRIFHLFDDQWLLLTCGDFGKKHFNAMTISWGSMGIMWNRPFVQVVVRPTRYTLEFMNQYDSFTVSAFGESHRDALNLLGSRSGRDGDKIAASGLTPVASQKVAAPSFAEAELVLECRKLFWQDIDHSHFVDAGIEKHYPKKDYHRMFFGEVVGIFGK
ncbi:MAG: flavin reductase family protein [Anaerolineaceae bacterium]|jgi:flavin reductase (DIM6/NTAB) family NADH-FMN oxidoreductase RutF